MKMLVKSHSRCLIASLCAATTLCALPVAAQLPTDVHTRLAVPAGFETEQYLRALQVAGIAPLYPWTVRSFGSDELKYLVPSIDSQHPWSARVRPGVARRLDAYIIAPQVQAFYNTTLPYGANDGPIWAGRGLTTDLQFGFGASAGPVSLIVAPEVFRAENRAFPLIANSSGELAYASPYVVGIDDPQRFGARPYQRFDAGQSTLRIAEGPAAIGISTANEYWGPAAFNPVILGNNAGGFPHAFAGTSHPVDLWIAKVHGRAIWGRLDQSSYVDVSGETRRFAAGVAAILEPRGLPGLEIGASRFYHEVWPAKGPGWDDFTRPFKLNAFAESRANLAGKEVANQLASIFFRWAFPGTGLEAYGEYGREDFATDIIDVAAEPDHDAAYTVGVHRVLRWSGNRLVVLKGEIMNARMTRLQIVRQQSPFYVHSPIVQGHTELGQVLGAPAGFGGGGTNVSVDVYTAGGRWSAGLSRRMVDQTQAAGSEFYGLTLERLWFRRYADLRVAATQAVQLNRRPGQDVGNLNLQIGTLLHW
jgi:hypothetical protein